MKFPHIFFLMLLTLNFSLIEEIFAKPDEIPDSHSLKGDLFSLG